MKARARKTQAQRLQWHRVWHRKPLQSAARLWVSHMQSTGQWSRPALADLRPAS